ncbi:hypothetical protein [Blastococcus sp. LR1]|uniref:hypothetical protein n=1 Tax=Blastococcus sp. LR1 TaxID=2877000 RepID=UPI001CC950C3|nr:hypothetical protein [Blastococcus sp. LR1]MCA0145522.1 hypothetical protein [Blastococcus sp. LR1]
MLVEAVRAMVLDVAADLPPTAVAVTERAELSASGTTVAFEMQPRTPGAARVELTPDDGDTVFVAIGEHGWLEVFFGEHEWSELIPAVRDLVSAAVEGRVRERRWSRRGRVSGARTELLEGTRWRAVGDAGRVRLRRSNRADVHRCVPWAFTDS